MCGNKVTELPRKTKYPRYHIFCCDVCGLTVETEDPEEFMDIEKA